MRKQHGIDISQLLINGLLALAAIICLVPLLHIVALSFSASTPIATGQVSFWPKQPTFAAYLYSLRKSELLRSLWISVQRVLIGCTLNISITVLAAYPLSKEPSVFRWRTFYCWVFVATMFFGGGLIPTYMVVLKTGLIDTIFALVLPTAVSAFNVVLMINFFRSIPKALEESAAIDGAGHFIRLTCIYVPLSSAAIATITLFSFVGHWNSWLDGLMYMSDARMYPLQTYLQSLVVSTNLNIIYGGNMPDLDLINAQNTKAAQVVIASIPIVVIYPYLQRYFTKGIILGSVKG